MTVFVRRVITVVLLLSLLAGAGPARAGGIAVTTTADNLAVDGECSLREAVLAANTGTLVDTCDGSVDSPEILLQPGLVYLLSLKGPDGPEAGDLDLKAGMAITGDPTNPAVISAEGLGDRVLHINSDAPVTLTGVEISGGAAEGNGNRGGGIYVENGTVTLNVVNVSGNASEGAGGGIYVENGNFSLNLVNVSANTSGDAGGGLYVHHGSASLNVVIVSDNTSLNAGGGVFVNTGAATNIHRSMIRGNQARYGGGIYNAGKLTVVSSSIIDNLAFANQGAPIGGGLYNYALEPGFATLINSTVARNSVTTALPSRTAGIYASGKLTLENVTIVDNDGTGLEISTASNAAISVVRNSIIARHPAADGNCRLPVMGGAPLNGRRNLADDATCRLDPVLDAEVPPAFVGLATEPAKFGTLTLMYDLLWNSPANNLGVDCASPDQRGMARAARCDLGAVEREGPDPFSTWMAAANR